MIFKKIDFDVLPKIREFFAHESYGTCDFTIGGLYMWIAYYSYEYCFYEDVLFIRGIHKGKQYYALPLGNTAKGIEMLVKEDEHVRFNIVPAEALKYFEKYNKEYVLLTDWADYVYSAKELASLEGSQYKKKRNLLHQFEGSYEYEFSYITNVNEILDEYEYMFHKDEEMAIYEKNQTIEVLKNFDKYGFIGGVLYVDKRVVAFCIGEIIHDMLFVHIEKANTSYKGVFQAINYFFVKQVCQDYDIVYVNREEDVGDIGLRQSKESYFPIIMKNKYQILF